MTTASSRRFAGSRGAIRSPRYAPAVAAPARTANHHVGSPLRRSANASANSRNPLAARSPAAPIAGAVSCGDRAALGDLGLPALHARMRQSEVQHRGDAVGDGRSVQDRLGAAELQEPERGPGRQHGSARGDATEAGVRAHEPLVRSRVRDDEPVLRDRVDLRQDQQQERGGEQQQRAEPGRRVQADHGSADRRAERDRAPGPRAVEQRHQERPGDRERRDREREERRHLEPSASPTGISKNTDSGERDRHHRVAGHAAEVREPVRVERVVRAPHAPERPEQRLDHRDQSEQDELPPGVAFRRPPVDPHRLPDQDPDKRWRSSSRTAFGSAEPPDFFIT